MLEGSWPDAPAAPAPPGEPPFVALELGAQFTLLPQYPASRAGVAMRVLDASEDFVRCYEGAAALPLAGEPEARTPLDAGHSCSESESCCRLNF